MRRWHLSLDSRQREILGLLLLALGTRTLLSLLNVTPGTVSGWWAGFLRRLFGWGAYPVALALGVGGVVLLAHNLQPGNIIGWNMVIGKRSWPLLPSSLMGWTWMVYEVEPHPDERMARTVRRIVPSCPTSHPHSEVYAVQFRFLSRILD